MGDFVQVHIICTLNCDVAALDKAVLRPGRQRFYYEFSPLTFPQARQLATHLGKRLVDEKPHTLAEIYHQDHLAQGELLGTPEDKPIGF